MTGDTVLHERVARLETRADNQESQVQIIHKRLTSLHDEVHEGHNAIRHDIHMIANSLDEKLDTLFMSKAKAQGALWASAKWAGGITVIIGIAVSIAALV